MNEQRFVVPDVLWQRLKSYLPGRLSDAVATAKDNRLFLEAVLWRVRTGALWRDLPPTFGHWNSQFRRFRRWAKSGVFEGLFKALSEDPDPKYTLIDGTIVGLHQEATGSKGASASGHWALARWANDKDHRVGECARQFGSVSAAAGASA